MTYTNFDVVGIPKILVDSRHPRIGIISVAPIVALVGLIPFLLAGKHSITLGT